VKGGHSLNLARFQSGQMSVILGFDKRALDPKFLIKQKAPFERAPLDELLILCLYHDAPSTYCLIYFTSYFILKIRTTVRKDESIAGIHSRFFI